MIRVNVDLVPFGLLDPLAIATLEIGNRNAHDEICDYDFRIGAQDPASGEPIFGPWRVVAAHHRSDGIWALIERILAVRDNAPLSDYNEPAQTP